MDVAMAQPVPRLLQAVDQREDLVVAIHHTQSIDHILLKIGAESEASLRGPEKDAAALQRPASLKSARFSTSVHGRTSRRQATE
jgi:hypothetical protein